MKPSCSTSWRCDPTVVDVEEASLWLAGDPDIFGPGSSLKPVAGEIVAILTADEEDERQ